MFKNIVLSLTLLIPAIAHAGVQPISHPSPNSGTITPTAIISGTASFTGSVTASSVTSQGDASVVGNLGIGEAASGTIGLSVKKGEVRFWNLGQHELEWGNGNIEFFEWLSGTGGGTILNNKSAPLSGGYISIPSGGAATIGLMPTSGSVGIGTASPATTLDVNGNAQFGSGATKSTFTATGFWEPISKTKAQIDALVPTKVGQVIYASDTTLPGLCISTGTAAAQWRKMESATLGCGTNN